MFQSVGSINGIVISDLTNGILIGKGRKTPIHMKSGHESPQKQLTDGRLLLEELRIEDLSESLRTGLPAKLNSFEILFIKDGKGTLAVDNREYPLRNSTFFCLAPGQYRLLQTNGYPTGNRISFSLQFLLLANGQKNYYTTEWLVPSTNELDDLLTRMNQELSSQDIVSSEVIRSLFKVFMIYLRRRSERRNDPVDAGRNDKLMVQQFFMLLQKFHVSKKLVADYAAELCITPNYLNAVVKKQTGFPASYHIQQFIIVEAKRQAIYSDLRMKEVAERLGFDDYAHFSKFFKNYSGMNFSEFRRSAIA